MDKSQKILQINNEAIYQHELDEELKKITNKYQQELDSQEFQGVQGKLIDLARQNVIDRVLLKQEVEKLDVEVPYQEVLEEFENMKKHYGGDKAFYEHFSIDPSHDQRLKEGIELSLKIDKHLASIPSSDAEPDEAELYEVYDKNKDKLLLSERVRIAHILIREPVKRDKAYEILEKVTTLHHEGKSFYDLAKNFSECPSAKQGGDLGYITRDLVDPSFEKASFALEKNQVSQIIKSQHGYHLIKKLDHKKSGELEYEEVKEQLHKQWQENYRSKTVKEYFKGLRSQANIVSFKNQSNFHQ